MFFENIFNRFNGITLEAVLICSLISLVGGILFSVIYRFTTRNYSKSMISALIILPVAVETVIIVVGESFGAGVAVAGAFALIRFRSVPASAKEITLMFSAMSVGLACGSGVIMLGVVMMVILSLIFIVLGILPFGKDDKKAKKLKVTVPEDLDYTTAFDDIFPKYTKKCEVIKVKTTGLGSMYEITYDVIVNDLIAEKNLIDEIRLRNGNLNVVSTSKDENKEIF